MPCFSGRLLDAERRVFSFLRSIVRKEKVVGLLLVVIALLSACRGGANSNSATPPASARQVTDDLGRSVNLPPKVERIVSLAPSVTEIVYAAGAGDRLVGVTTFCNFPAQAAEVAKVGDTLNPNMETIVALKPDLVLVSTASQIEAFTKTLSDNGIAVYVTNPTTLEAVIQTVRKFGEILATSTVAEAAAADLNRRVGDVWTKLQLEAKVRVFVQVSKEPLFTIGKESFLNEPIAKAGGISVTADVETAFPKLSKETASALKPEAIILSESDDNREPNEVFASSPAVKNGRVYKINADLLSRPGPRLVDAYEQIAKYLHPEKFGAVAK